ncbi:MAG: GNAT family N-acetyltransferase, partial [Candidatus Micrarchaeota archaeon]|nr:GNAT family N-acetyltransferase [Candidatus Micrarchaeota archaeon]
MIRWIFGGKEIARNAIDTVHLERLLRDKKDGQEVYIEKVSKPERLETETINALISLTRKGFGREDMDREEVLDHILETDILHLLKIDGRLIGFASYSVFDMNIRPNPTFPRRILYLNGVVMDKESQGKGVGPASILEALKEHLPDALTLRTQNPAMYSAVKKISAGIGLEHKLFPSLRNVVDVEARDIAKGLSEKLREKHYDS